MLFLCFPLHSLLSHLICTPVVLRGTVEELLSLHHYLIIHDSTCLYQLLLLSLLPAAVSKILMFFLQLDVPFFIFLCHPVCTVQLYLRWCCLQSLRYGHTTNFSVMAHQCFLSCSQSRSLFMLYMLYLFVYFYSVNFDKFSRVFLACLPVAYQYKYSVWLLPTRSNFSAMSQQ